MLSVFPPKVCVTVTQKVFMISQHSFRFRFLRTVSFGYLHFKACMWLSPRNIGISMWLNEYIVKLFTFSANKNQMLVTLNTDVTFFF